MRFYALLTKGGTACAETTLREDDYKTEMRASVERAAPYSTFRDPPVVGTWTDVTDNACCVATYSDEFGDD